MAEFYLDKKDGLRRIRPHLSWSQYSCFMRSPADYIMRYFYGNNRENPAMMLGKTVAEMLETDAEQDDVMLDTLRIMLPQYQHREYKLEAILNGVPLLGFMDGFDSDPIEIAEFKTGKHWDQDMADQTEQLTMYALMLHLKTGIRPEAMPMRLIWMPTEWNDGDPKLTGEIISFKTRRTMMDCLVMGKKLCDVWHKIGIACEEEFKATGQ